jgi:hypothetical protein
MIQKEEKLYELLECVKLVIRVLSDAKMMKEENKNPI